MRSLPTSVLSASARAPATLALLLLGLVALAGCQTNRAGLDEVRGTPTAIYEAARKRLDSQDYDAAIRTLEALVTRYPFAPEARQARLDLIFAYYKGRETESALDQADTFIRENPTHPRLDYAYYIKGLVEFERSANFIERWFRADLDARPPQTARSAFNSLRKVAVDYPDSLYAHDARRRMIHLRNRLADYEIYVARYYMRRGAWVGAAQRAKSTIEQYDGAPAVREALEILVESYEQLQMKELAAQSREVYQLNYGSEPRKDPAVKKRWWKPFGNG